MASASTPARPASRAGRVHRRRNAAAFFYFFFSAPSSRAAGDGGQREHGGPDQPAEEARPERHADDQEAGAGGGAGRARHAGRQRGPLRAAALGRLPEALAAHHLRVARLPQTPIKAQRDHERAKGFPISQSCAHTHILARQPRQADACRLHTAAVTPSEDVLEQGRLRPSALLQAHLPRSVTLNLEQGRQRTSSMTSYSLRQAASARVGAHPNPQTPGFTGREGAADLLDDVVLPAPGGIRARGRAPRLRRQPLLAAEQPGLQLARGRAEPQLRAMQTEVLGTVSYWLTGSRAARSPARARPR